MSKEKRYLSLFLIICIACIGTVFSVDASPKIKSKSVALNVGKATIGTGDIITLDAVMKPINSTDTIKWSSSNTKVATVNKYGVVTGVGEGKATITAKTSSKKKAKCVVTVKRQLSKEEISALISKECLSEETVKKLIKDNTLSEADVKKIVAENANGGMGSTDWEDGTELKMLSNQSLPFSSCYSEQGQEDSNTRVTIEKITVKKYHYNGEWYGKPQKYKYIVKMEGSLSDNFDATKYVVSAVLQLMNNCASERRRYWFEDISDELVVSSYQVNGGKFVLTVEQYNIYADYNEYIISDMECDDVEGGK